jgi:hypothetical protein
MDVHPPEIWYFNDFQCVFVGFDPIPLLLWWPIPSSTTEERRRPCRRSFAEKRAAWCQSYWGWRVQLFGPPTVLGIGTGGTGNLYL